MYTVHATELVGTNPKMFLMNDSVKWYDDLIVPYASQVFVRTPCHKAAPQLSLRSWLPACTVSMMPLKVSAAIFVLGGCSKSASPSFASVNRHQTRWRAGRLMGTFSWEEMFCWNDTRNVALKDRQLCFVKILWRCYEIFLWNFTPNFASFMKVYRAKQRQVTDR